MSADRSPRPEEAAEPAAPARCPFCGSEAIAEVSGKVSASTYRRCNKCSQLWNPERLRLHWHATRLTR
jgi:hypothetical protein